jgi:protein-disulfide isomerase
MIDRRLLLSLLAGTAITSASGSFAQQAARPTETVDVTELAVPGPLGDQIMGSADAKVTIVEYASMTCVHCANFHKEGYRHLKEKYVDTGKVRFILRELPFDPLSAAAFMLARCAGDGKYFGMIELLFAQQAAWTQTNKPVDALLSVAKQAGFTQETFETCLKNQQIYDGVNAVRTRAQEKFGVDSTPSFFVNGRRYGGNLSAQQLEAIIEPLLK